MDGYSNRVPERGGLVARWAALSPHSKSGSSGCIKENEQRMVWPNGSSVEMTFWAFSGHYRSSYWLGERGIKQKRGGGGGGGIQLVAICSLLLDTIRFYTRILLHTHVQGIFWGWLLTVYLSFANRLWKSYKDLGVWHKHFGSEGVLAASGEWIRMHSDNLTDIVWVLLLCANAEHKI